MQAKKERLTLDLDPPVQRRLKAVAALKGISMRRYCLAALERALGDPSLGARKTPHRFPAGTPASASPPGEGEERIGLEGSWWFGGGCAEAPSPSSGEVARILLSPRRG